MSKWLLPAAILIMAIVYIFIHSAMLFKLIPMWLIMVYAYQQRPKLSDRYFILTMIGLFFCMLGDYLLQWFVVGLTAFLIGHLFYIAAFSKRWNFHWLRFFTIIPLVAYGGYMGMEMYSALTASGQDSLIIPVFCYLIIILLMGWLAIMTGNIWATVGSVLFIISDSILAWNKFVAEVTYAGPLIMTTYYTAQFLIARSIRRQEAAVIEAAPAR